jgi:hypothetical protein
MIPPSGVSKKGDLRPVVIPFDSPYRESRPKIALKLSADFLRSSRPQDLRQFSAFGQLINELVEVSCLLRQRILDFFNSVATDNPRDEVSIGVQLGLREELFKGDLVLDKVLKCFLAKASQLANHLVQLFDGSTLFFDFGHIVWIDGCERHLRDAIVMMAGVVHA